MKTYLVCDTVHSSTFRDNDSRDPVVKLILEIKIYNIKHVMSCQMKQYYVCAQDLHTQRKICLFEFKKLIHVDITSSR